jgi:hypothetical protein
MLVRDRRSQQLTTSPFRPRYDFTFSYWILAWFFLYYTKIIPYNPISWLWLAVLHNIITLSLMFYYHNSAINVGLYILINLIKVIPIWVLRKTDFYEEDFICGAILFGIHLWWLSLHRKSYLQYSKEGLQRIKQNLPVGPTGYLIVKYLKKYRFII